MEAENETATSELDLAGEVELLKRRLNLMELLVHGIGELLLTHVPHLREPMLEITGKLVDQYADLKEAEETRAAAQQAEMVRRKS